jgi:hypothetical protein
MTLCEQCGSTRIERTLPEPIDRLVAIFTGVRPFLCLRCGWRGRRNWTDDDLKALLDYGAGGAELDPALAALDNEELPRGRRKRQTKGRKTRKSRVKPVPDTFGLNALVLASAELGAEVEEGTVRPASESQPPRGVKRKPSARREIVTAIFVAALVMLIVFFLSIAPGCVEGI